MKNTLILKENGKEKKYDILLSFTENDENYLVYTDPVKEDDGFVKTYAGKYVEIDGEARLLPVLDEHILEQIDNLINKIDGE